MKLNNNQPSKETKKEIPYFLKSISIEAEKKKIILYLKHWESLSDGIKLLGNKLNRMPTDEEIIKYFWWFKI